MSTLSQSLATDSLNRTLSLREQLRYPPGNSQVSLGHSVAGLSVGALPPGALACKDGFALVKVRAELMEKAVLPPCMRPNIRPGGCEEIGGVN